MNQQLISLGISHISHSYDVEKIVSIMVHYVFYCFLHICDFLLLKHFLSDVLHGAKRRTTKEKSKQREFAHYECPCYKADGGGGQRGFLFGSLGERLVN